MPKMSKLHHITIWLGVIILAALAVGLSSVGYGSCQIEAKMEHSHGNKAPSPTHLSVIYERTNAGHSDLLHLKVDTTYHARGKRGYCYEFVCNHDISLFAFDGQYTALDIAPNRCFIAGGERNWLKTNTKKSILGYECHNAQLISDNTLWEVWYSDALPHAPSIMPLTSRYKGIILAACNGSKTYTLKAINIRQTII